MSLWSRLHTWHVHRIVKPEQRIPKRGYVSPSTESEVMSREAFEERRGITAPTYQGFLFPLATEFLCSHPSPDYILISYNATLREETHLGRRGGGSRREVYASRRWSRKEPSSRRHSQLFLLSFGKDAEYLVG